MIYTGFVRTATITNLTMETLRLKTVIQSTSWAVLLVREKKCAMVRKWNHLSVSKVSARRTF